MARGLRNRRPLPVPAGRVVLRQPGCVLLCDVIWLVTECIYNSFGVSGCTAARFRHYSMTNADLEQYIRAEKARTDSIDEQVTIAHAMWDADLDQGHDGVKRADLEDELGLDLEYNIGTSLGHLEEIDVVDTTTPSGPSWYVISERRDTIINGEVDETAATDIERLITDMQADDPATDDETSAVADGAGVTVRTVVANEFDIMPEAVEQFLRKGDQVDKLNKAIDAIEDHDDVEMGDDYGRIIFRGAAYRYRLTKKAVDLCEQDPDGAEDEEMGDADS